MVELIERFECAEGAKEWEVTFDAVYEIVWKTLLHPKGAWGLAAGAFMNDKLQFGWRFLSVFFYATVVSFIHIFYVTNRWMISKRPCIYKPSQDVVVVTGGRRGLGLLLAAEFSSRGFKVATIDIFERKLALANSIHYIADVGDEYSLAKALAAVREQLGTPTILINCAGVVQGGLTEQISSADIQNLMNVNFLGPSNLIRNCIGTMKEMNRGYIINISSSTAYLGPAKAGYYAASKSALMTFHEALRHELSDTEIKSLLVIPGQLDSVMFETVITPDKFFAPILRGSELVAQILTYVEHGWCGQIQEPAYVKFLPLAVALLPTSIIDLLRRWNGMDKAMDTFQPR